MISSLLLSYKSILLLTLFPFARVSGFYVNYFAYGSNLNPSVLERRTLSSENSLLHKYDLGIVKDYALKFNIGAPIGPLVASVVPEKDSECHGIVYKLSAAQWALLLASEGYPILPAYKIETVQVRTYKGDRILSAQTLGSTSVGVSDGGKPSKRYINLLRKGAREQNLEESWIDYLEAIESYD